MQIESRASSGFSQNSTSRAPSIGEVGGYFAEKLKGLSYAINTKTTGEWARRELGVGVNRAAGVAERAAEAAGSKMKSIRGLESEPSDEEREILVDQIVLVSKAHIPQIAEILSDPETAHHLHLPYGGDLEKDILDFYFPNSQEFMRATLVAENYRGLVLGFGSVTFPDPNIKQGEHESLKEFAARIMNEPYVYLERGVTRPGKPYRDKGVARELALSRHDWAFKRKKKIRIGEQEYETEIAGSRAYIDIKRGMDAPFLLSEEIGYRTYGDYYDQPGADKVAFNYNGTLRQLTRDEYYAHRPFLKRKIAENRAKIHKQFSESKST